MTVRKNFLFDEKMILKLEEIADKKATTQTKVVFEAIDKLYKEMQKEKKLEALKNLKGSFDGMLKDADIQDAKIKRAVYRAK